MTGFPFRRRALERVSSPEELDRLVKVALPRTWIALAGLALLILAASVWAVVARVPTTVQASGYLLREGGIRVVAAPTAGLVVDTLRRAATVSPARWSGTSRARTAGCRRRGRRRPAGCSR